MKKYALILAGLRTLLAIALLTFGAFAARADPVACAKLALKITVSDVGGTPATRLLTNAQVIALCAKAGTAAIAPITCLKNALALKSRDDFSARAGVFSVDESVQLCAGAQ